MAYFRKVSGGWRAEVVRNGKRRSATKSTKAAAISWATMVEAEILADQGRKFPRKTLLDAIRRYRLEVSPSKRGERAEGLRFDALERDFPKLVEKQLVDIRTPDLVEWRDNRLAEVTAGSVQRDINLLRNLFNIARDEWHWRDGNPFAGMRMPGQNPSRTRRITPLEVRKLCRWLGYVTGQVATKQQQVALAFLIALRTGMRAGEILQLGDETVDLAKRVATLRHKTQHISGKPRQVPLSRAAIRLIRPYLGRGQIFDVSSSVLDALFRKARDKLLLKDLHFHDSRAEALTRLARKVDVMTLARISGHKDLRILLYTYYRETSEDIAARLA